MKYYEGFYQITLHVNAFLYGGNNILATVHND